MPACAAPQDLFFHYTFNNFLHAQVELCVRAVLSAGPPSDSSLEIPAPNPAVKHVRWGSQVPLPVPVGPRLSPCPAAGACQAASWAVGGQASSLVLRFVCLGEWGMPCRWVERQNAL